MPKEQQALVVSIIINPEDPLFWSIINDLVDYVGDESLFESVLEAVENQMESISAEEMGYQDGQFMCELEREILKDLYTRNHPLSDDRV